MKTKFFTHLLTLGLLLGLALCLGSTNDASANTIIIVKSSALNGWSLVQEIATAAGSLVTGPATTPLGSGSARMTLDATGRFLLGTLAYAGTRLDQLTNLQYATYRSSADAGNNLAISLQFDMDYDLTDGNTAWQGRLVFEPYLTPGVGGTVVQNTWQTWSPLAGRWWASGAPGNTVCSQASPCAWATVLSNFPNAGLRASVGVLQFKAGGPWPNFDGNVDAFTIGVSGNETTYNFEPETPCTTLCYVNTATGNDAFGGDTPSSAKKTIQAAINQVNSAGTVMVAAGTYNESPNITKALTLQSSGGRDVTTIALQTGPTYLGSLTIGASNVTVDGFTITGFNAVGAGLASSNLLLNPALDNIVIQNNRLLVGQIGPGSNGDDGIGLLTTYDTNNLLGHLTVSGNDFAPVGTEANRAFYINPGVDNFTFTQNTISGKFTRTAITQAKNGMLAENTLTGVGAAGSRSAGLGTWGYPDPAVWGHTLFQHNEISGVGAGIAIFETENVVIAGNKFDQIGRAVWVREITPLTVDLTTISINQNSITNSDTSGVDNSISASGAINAATNWWGSYTGPTHASNTGGSGAGVSDNVTFKPWLCQGTDTSPAIGFQPNTLTLCPNLFYFPIMFKN